MKNKLSDADCVSIVMPMYNAEAHIEACLESIVKQSYSNWQLIVVNDFSTDRSKDIVERFSLRDSRISCVDNIEKGIIPALQLAYSLSIGNFITRMDADDIMPTNKLESLQSNCIPNVCVTAKVKYFSDDELFGGYIRYAEWLNSLVDNANHYSAIYKECIIPSPCWMMCRETFDKIGGFQSEIYPEDYDLCFRMYEHNITILGIDGILHLWRDHGSRASRNDPNYMDQHFLKLKMHYFKKLEYQTADKIVLWGAGKTGKLWAKGLAESGLNYRWITGNPKKIGHNIFDIILESDEKISTLTNCHIIFAIKEKGFVEANHALLQNLLGNNKIYFMY